VQLPHRVSLEAVTRDCRNLSYDETVSEGHIEIFRMCDPGSSHYPTDVRLVHMEDRVGGNPGGWRVENLLRRIRKVFAKIPQTGRSIR
jgi:hypothetical protein